MPSDVVPPAAAPDLDVDEVSQQSQDAIARARELAAGLHDLSDRERAIFEGIRKARKRKSGSDPEL